ncbi:hypothetical protein AGMMS50293_11440 [Spirochaetia bacterium]|nr:hypothetical protein AGMMS50293_11440 [Spirochaetia bacterium]
MLSSGRLQFSALLVMVLFAAFDLYAAPDPALVEALKPAAKRGMLFWSSEVTVTTAEKAPELIEQGKSNIKINGKIANEQIADISGALIKAENKNQLVRLDLSESRGLTELGRNAFRNRANLGSIILPEGLTFIERDAFLDASNLIEAVLPDTLAKANGNVFHRSGLVKAGLPAKLEWDGFRFIAPTGDAWIITFTDGRAALHINDFAAHAKEPKGAIKRNTTHSR